MHGTKNNVKNSVFGGGNKAPTGNKDTNNSNSNVNIAGGKIGKNVYGGANTSVVYGATNTNIGKDTIENYEKHCYCCWICDKAWRIDKELSEAFVENR